MTLHVVVKCIIYFITVIIAVVYYLFNLKDVIDIVILLSGII